MAFYLEKCNEENATEPVPVAPAVPRPVQDTPGMHAVAGAIGGCAALAITYPLQTISMRLQIHSRGKHHRGRGEQKTSGDSSDESLGHSDSQEVSDESPRERSAVSQFESIRAVRKMLQEGGWQRLYSGLGSALYGQMIIQAVYYYFYALMQRVLQRLKQGRLTSLETTLCASIAGVAGAVVTNPLWVVNARKVKTGSSKSTMAELAELVKAEGVAGLFRGLVPALILVSNPTIQYGVFEWLKRVLVAKREHTKISAAEIFLLGAIGKLVATLITYPYIMAKTTLQAQNNDSAHRQYTGTFDCLRDVYNQKGFLAVYKGLNSKIWQSILTAALLFVLQDKCLRLVRAVARMAKS